MPDIFHDKSFVIRLVNFAYSKMQSYSRVLPTEYCSRRKVSKAINGKGKEWFVTRLQAVSNVCPTTFPGKEYANDLKTVLRSADEVLDGSIRILGGVVCIKDINWHRDFKSGYQWPKGVFYKKYRPTRFNTPEDVKSVWDLSRCHYLLWLGQAYMATKDEKYAQRVVELIENWIKENPYRKSINWTCPMDIAIRAINWIYATSMISESEAVDKPFLECLYVSLFQHGKFIYSNLEYQYPFSANHYATNVMGLLYLGRLFDFMKEGRKWLQYSTKSFLYEVRTQILPTGVHFERSISYHRLMCEIFLYSYDLLQRTSPETISSPDIRYRIASMIDFVDSYTKPSGNAPLFGDNDDGRILPFVERQFYDHRYLLDIASKVLGNNSYKNRIGNVLDTIYFTASEDKGLIHTSGNDDVKMYQDAGFAILRNSTMYTMFSNTGISRYLTTQMIKAPKIGTHTHLDALTFELSAGTSDFIVDAGSYTYTSDKPKRDEYRSTAKHNTLTINGCSQYTINENDYFCFKGKYEDPQPIAYCKNEGNETVTSAFHWHLKEHEAEHIRSISLRENEVCIHDQVTAKTDNTNSYEWNFYLAADITTNISSEGIELRSSQGDILLLSIECNTGYNIEIQECCISPSYGIETKSKRIKICIVSVENINIKYTFKTK